MKFSSYPVVEVEVKGEILRFEQDNGSMHVGTSVWPCSLVLLKWMESHVSSSSSSSQPALRSSSNCQGPGQVHGNGLSCQDQGQGHNSHGTEAQAQGPHGVGDGDADDQGHALAGHGHDHRSDDDLGDDGHGYDNCDGDTFFDLRGKHGIELGSGCGVAGLGFALLGLNTILTDIAPVLPALKRNVKKNVAATSLRFPGTPPSLTGKVKIAQLYWGNRSQISALKPPFDYIIATDVVYIENIVEPLLSTFSDLAGPATIIFLGYQIRSPEAHEIFWRLCPELFHVKKVPHVSLHPDYAFEEADVFILKKKGL